MIPGPSNDIHRLPDGSLDIAFYVTKCHKERSLAAHRRLRKIAGYITRLSLVASRFFRWRAGGGCGWHVGRPSHT